MPTYTVKPGDTVYSIAAKFGQDYKQVAAWNGLDSTYHLHVDQVLRMGPPEGQGAGPVAESSPVGTSVLEQHALGAPGDAPASAAGAPSGAPQPGAAPATNDAPMKTGPLALKKPYSDATLAELTRPDGPDAAPPPSGPPPTLAALAAPPGGPPLAAPGATEVDEATIGWIWPAKGPLLSEFNDPKNKGIDIAGKMGDPVIASGSGTVIYVGQGLRGLGNLVVVKHTEGLISVYAHNSKILVANNQPVKRGEQIAEMGNSDSEKVELHFEIRRQGAPVDPLKYLPSR